VARNFGDRGPVKTYGTNRQCVTCHGPLSIYNPDDECNTCQASVPSRIGRPGSTRSRGSRRGETVVGSPQRVARPAHGGAR
jgi:hypothetical protein